MRDRGRIKAPSSDPIEALRTQLREQDRKLDDLYRRIPVPPPPAAAAAAVAFTHAAFSYATTSNQDFTTAANGSYLQMTKTFATGWDAAPTTITTNITPPSGVWLFLLSAASRSVSTAPSSGQFQLYLPTDRSEANWQLLADPNLSFVNLHCFETRNSDGSVIVDARITNGTNQSIRIATGAELIGIKVADYVAP